MSSDTTHPAQPTRRPINRAWWLVPVLLGVVAVVCMRTPLWPFEPYSGAFIDLQVYRLGIEAMRDGADMYGQLPKTSVGIGLPFIYPPFAAIALAPFALLPWGAAKTLYVAVSVAALAWTLYLVARRYNPERKQVALLVTACALPVAMLLEPVRATIDFGQVNLLLMVLVATDCLLPKTRYPRGMLIGLAAAVKLTPAAFVLFFLVRKDYKAAATAAATGAVATLVSFAILPTESVRYWFGGLGNVSGLSGSAFHTNQSIQAVLARLHVTGLPFDALWLVFGALLLALVVAAMRKAADAPAIALALNAVFTLLLSPISWSHHWVWIAPALLAIVCHARTVPAAPARGWYATALVVAAVFIIAPHSFLPDGEHRETSWTWNQHLIGDTYVWSAVALVVLFLLTGRRRASSSSTLEPARPEVIPAA
ncbi:glycosyltransferase 87 family protein [Nocardia caishijiensis]|uniref:Alpha-1,2-mannosyltransferase n=1 Tax=Nocardia caishijiensis TaxID=184756 RepID=A0ABQ6YGG1_9NOCA|nr:glycosyltransferase 87 family protein [Nocardia caishijiensis]KAF0844872.1 alpha-1,2-mannosyltransferase [Nocardia caishijiensis]